MRKLESGKQQTLGWFSQINKELSIVRIYYIYHNYSLFWWWFWITLMREFWWTSPDFPFRLLIEFSFPSILVPNLAYLPTSHWAPPNDFLYRDTTWYHRQQPAVQQQIQLCRKSSFNACVQLLAKSHVTFFRTTSSRLQSTPCLHSSPSTSLNSSSVQQTSTFSASSSYR